MSHTVYFGKINNKIVYIGTTIQKPSERFRWHRYNGKDLDFEIHKQFDNSDDMLNCEFELIKKLNPKLNKITKRKQNLNRKLTAEELKRRVGEKEWCQSCLKRRVNKGYSKCYYC
jgi:hypothetical protein